MDMNRRSFSAALAALVAAPKALMALKPAKEFPYFVVTPAPVEGSLMWYSAENFDERTGILYDSSGNGNHAIDFGHRVHRVEAFDRPLSDEERDEVYARLLSDEPVIDPRPTLSWRND